jgi:hypothetical protein
MKRRPVPWGHGAVRTMRHTWCRFYPPATLETDMQMHHVAFRQRDDTHSAEGHMFEQSSNILLIATETIHRFREHDDEFAANKKTPTSFRKPGFGCLCFRKNRWLRGVARIGACGRKKPPCGGRLMCAIWDRI